MKNENTKAAAFDQKIRLMYLEAKLFTDGNVYTGILTDLGIGRAQASKDLNEYLFRFPGAMHYDRSVKRYQLNNTHKPGLIYRQVFGDVIKSVELLSRLHHNY